MPGAVLERYEVGADDAEGVDHLVEEREARLVALADELAPLHRAEDLRVPVEDADERLGENEDLSLVAHADVIVIGTDRERDVRDQGPRRRRPDEEIGVLVDELELDMDGWILDVRVSLRHLVARERRAAARAVRDDLVPLVEHVLIPELLENPPDRFDVIVLEGDVRVVEIEPEAELLRELEPFVEILEDALAALLVERGDAVTLDLVLAVEAELVLDFDLDGKAVRVPAGLADDAVPLHRLIAADEILDRAREGVMNAGTSVRGRRPLVEHEGARGRPLLDAALEDAIRFPEGEDLRFELRGLAEGRELGVVFSGILFFGHNRFRRTGI